MKTAIIPTTLAILSLYITPFQGVAAPAPASPPWVAMQPPPPRIHKWLPSQDDVRRNAVLAGHFAEKMPLCTGIRLVSHARVYPLFRALNAHVAKAPVEEEVDPETTDEPGRITLFPALTGSPDLHPDGWFEFAHQILPVDAVVLFPIREEQAAVRVLFADRVLDMPLPGKPEGLFERIRRVADFLADTFALSAAERRILSEIEFPTEEAMVFHFITARFSASMPGNSGEKQLAYLHPMLAQHPGNIRMGEQVMRSARTQFLSRRTQNATPTVIQIANLSLLSVLGTPYENTVVEMVKLRPDAFAGSLIEIVEYDAAQKKLDSALDNFLIDAPAGADLVTDMRTAADAAQALDSSRVGWNEFAASYMLAPLRPLNWTWGEIKPSHRLGALRVLGHVQSPAARKILLDAAKSKDAAFREATALGLAWQEHAAALGTLRRLAGDSDAAVARAARLGLWKHDVIDPKLLGDLRAARDDFFNAVPLAAEAFAALAEASDANRLWAIDRLAGNSVRLSILRALFRLDALDEKAVADILRFESPELALETLRQLKDRPLPATALPLVTRLTADPDPAMAAAAFALLGSREDSSKDTGGQGGTLFDLNFGSPYQRLSILSGVAASEDSIAEADILEAAATNALALIRYKALQLIDAHYPERSAERIPAGLSDPHPWVRMQAAAMAVDHPSPTLAASIRTALAKEASDSIRTALEIALAKATGASPPPPRAPARPHADAIPRVWSGSPLSHGYGRLPFEGFLCYRQASTKGAVEAGYPVYIRTLWGEIPGSESVVHDPQGFEDLWTKFESLFDNEQLQIIDGFDLRILGFGSSWPLSWRDFCRDAGINADRINGDQASLSIYEQRAFGHWTFERGISGFNIMYDLLKLKHRFTRPGIQVLSWISAGMLDGNVAAPLKRWKNDLIWNPPGYGSREWLAYLLARASRTSWPDRTFVYNAPEPGGIPGDWIYWNSPVPETFVFRSTNDLYAHTLQAWTAGAHFRPGGGWRFLEHTTVPAGLYTKSVNVSALSATKAIQQAIDYAFNDAPVKPPEKISTADALMTGGSKVDLGFDLDLGLELDDGKEDPEVTAMKANMLIGMQLMIKHIHDCARIFASLPRYIPAPDALAIQPGLYPASVQPLNGRPAIAGRELIGTFDLLPGINLLADHDLSGYRIIVVHNAALLHDETIRALTQWIRNTPGLLLIHMDLTADNAAQAATVTTHDGKLQEDWPWESDFSISADDSEGAARTVAFNLSAGKERIAIQADARVRHAVCHTPRAETLAQIDGKAVMVRWRHPEYRGAVIFDGLRAPSSPYVERLAAEINALAAQGIGRRATGRPGALEVRTDTFHTVINHGHGEAVLQPDRLTGIDLISGVVDPTVGPGHASAIVPLKNYFHRHLACTPDLVALGELEFSRAEAAEGGMLLQNTGVIQIAGRTPPRVTRASGKPLAQIPFDFAWVLNGSDDGVTTYRTAEGSVLTFVRCREAIRLEP